MSAARRLASLKRRLQRAGITQESIAKRAGVTRPHVSHVLAGRFNSARVIQAALELIDGNGTAA